MSAVAAPAQVRYAALDDPGGARHVHPETGHAYWYRPVGVDDLLAAGASLAEPDDVRLPCSARIEPGRDGAWVARLSRTWLRPDDPKVDGVMQFVATKQAGESRSFETREAAVAWLADASDGFAQACVEEVPA